MPSSIDPQDPITPEVDSAPATTVLDPKIAKKIDEQTLRPEDFDSMSAEQQTAAALYCTEKNSGPYFGGDFIIEFLPHVNKGDHNKILQAFLGKNRWAEVIYSLPYFHGLSGKTADMILNRAKKDGEDILKLTAGKIVKNLESFEGLTAEAVMQIAGHLDDIKLLIGDAHSDRLLNPVMERIIGIIERDYGNTDEELGYYQPWVKTLYDHVKARHGARTVVS